MSERKRGGLDYTPQAFPGARDPDGPAPDLEEKLAKLGLVQREAPKDVRPDASAGANPGAKKRTPLEYTPQAFPGARDPDGPAPGLEDRLVQMGLAERVEASEPAPRAKQDASYTPPPVRVERAATPPAPPAVSSVRTHREAPQPQRMAPSTASPPPPRRERVEPPREPTAQAPLFVEASQPVYVLMAPAAPSPAVIEEMPQPIARVAAPPRAVPPEPVPRPLPVVTTSAPAGASCDIRPAAKPPSRAAQTKARLKELPEKETRIRRSVRLAATVDSKLQELAHLRGLDLNTAVGVAIVQDWVNCFGLRTRQQER